MTDRELDMLVYENIFNGRATDFYVDWWGKLFKKPTLPHYSTDISAAWEIVNKLIEEDIFIKLSWCEGWEIDVYNPEKKRTYFLAENKSAPKAICLAALKAVGGDEFEGVIKK